jgi:hypothetical protein
MWAQRVEAFQKVDRHIAALLLEAAPDNSNVIHLSREPRPMG